MVLAYDENTDTYINVFPECNDSVDHQTCENGQTKKNVRGLEIK